MQSTPKLLLADDEPANLRAIMNILNKSEVQYEVFAVSNGRQMVEVAQKSLPDLIISDWDMPELSGVEAVRQLKQIPETQNIPVIMCTGVMISPANLKEALDAGASDYVRKPVEATELLARVNSMLNLSFSYRKIIEQKEELLELDRVKSRFFANISHEFRTPLTVILGVFDQLSSQKDLAVAQQLLQAGQRQGKALFELINQLLDLVKLESKKFQLNRTEVDLLAFLKGSIGSMQALAKQKSIQLKLLSEADTRQVWVDTQQLERIVFNLLSNAIKFTPQEGEVTCKLVSLSQESAVLEVSDTGIGIAPHQLPKVFDRFYQVEQENYNYQGTGIGLALTKELVELHGGSIEVESEPNRGTTFRFSLRVDVQGVLAEEAVASPTVAEANDAVEKSANSEAWVAQEGISEADDDKPLVLVVEDNQDLRNLIAVHLSGNYRVLQAVNGEEGLSMAIAEVPDLIISDVMMPKMDGFEMASQLRKHAATSHIPLIILTARAALEDRLAGLELGADDYLPKPFDKAELLIRVKNLISLRQLLKQHFSEQADEVLAEPELFKGSPADRNFIRELNQILEQFHRNEAFAADDLAEKVGMPRRSLDRKLKAIIDLSSAKMLQDFRLKKAQKLLLETHMQAGEIAFETGFSSRSYFNKCFKDKFGMTPLEFKGEQEQRHLRKEGD